MLYELEYFCPLCGRWLLVAVPPLPSLPAAVQTAAAWPHYQLRIVDDFEQMYDRYGRRIA